MKKSIAPLIFGLLLVLGGLAYVGSLVFGYRFDIFFDGWWSLFIIIPTFISIVANGPRTASVIGFIIGILLLLGAQDIIPYRYVGYSIFPLILVGIGIALIVHFFTKGKYDNAGDNYQEGQGYQGSQGSQDGYYTYQQPGQSEQSQTESAQTGSAQSEKSSASNGDSNSNSNNTNASGNPDAEQAQSQSNNNGNTSGGYTYNNGSHYSGDTNNLPNYNGILSATHVRNDSANLEGARVSAILGAVDLDLRDAIVTHDITIFVSAIMGGVDIYAPRNVRIVLEKSDILGGTDCKAYTLPQDSNAPICRFVCTTVMAGIDIK